MLALPPFATRSLPLAVSPGAFFLGQKPVKFPPPGGCPNGPVAMRALAAGVKPNSEAYLSMSLAAAAAIRASGLLRTSPVVVLINKPFVTRSRSAILASFSSAIRQRAKLWQYTASGMTSSGLNKPIT